MKKAKPKKAIKTSPSLTGEAAFDKTPDVKNSQRLPDFPVIKSMPEMKREKIMKEEVEKPECKHYKLRMAINEIGYRGLTCLECGKEFTKEGIKKMMAEIPKVEKPKECCLCGNPHDDWPHDKTDGYLCSDCWEKQCDRNWWITINQNERFVEFQKLKRLKLSLNLQKKLKKKYGLQVDDKLFY